VLQLLYIFILQISLKTLGEFQPKNYKASRSLAENYKSRQNTANPNISRIFWWFSWIYFFLNSVRKPKLVATVMVASRPHRRGITPLLRATGCVRRA